MGKTYRHYSDSFSKVRVKSIKDKKVKKSKSKMDKFNRINPMDEILQEIPEDENV
jgi:hypothetical protein